MNIQLDVQNIENYPGVTKRVTIDTDIVVPTGSEGDEKYMLSASTTAYADNANRTPIQNVYVAGGKIGWAKSSGFKGSNGKFSLDSTHNTLGVKMDATVSGTANGYYDISLDHYDGVAIKGEDIAADMQHKLRSVVCADVDAGFQLSYKNCSVKYVDNKFYISSGTIANKFTGPLRSSVAVAAGQTNDCSAMLGFDQPVTSEELSNISVIQAPLSADYTAADITVSVDILSGISAGDALCITDGVNTEYFIADGFTSGTIDITNSAITNSYSVASGAYVQVLQKIDPDYKSSNYYNDVDGLLRYMAKIMVNQIDFS